MDTLNKRRFFITMQHPLGIQDTKIWAKAISAHAKKCNRMEVLSLRGAYLPTPRVQKPGDNPKSFKVGAIFIIGFHFFQCNNSTLPTKN